MSNIEIVNELYAAYRRGDLQAILTALTDDVRWESEGPSEIPFMGIRNGVNETTGFFEGLARDWSDPRLETNQFIASGDEVSVFGRYEATNRQTGKRINVPIAHYWKIRDGKVARYMGLTDTGAFLEAMRQSNERSGSAGASGR